MAGTIGKHRIGDAFNPWTINDNPSYQLVAFEQVRSRNLRQTVNDPTLIASRSQPAATAASDSVAPRPQTSNHPDENTVVPQISSNPRLYNIVQSTQRTDRETTSDIHRQN